MGSRHYDQDKDSTLYVGNLDERCTDPLVWELMLQAGPVVNVHLPKDRVTQAHQGYGFVEFASEEDADYAAKIMNQIRVFGKPIRVNKASADRRGGGEAAAGGVGGGQGVGAELFVGNLEGMVDEKVLFETFSRFGPLVAPPKVARDEATNLSKGYGFISYASFEASDDAIANMHGQYLSNKEISVQYAYKKDGKGERHGDAAERALAAQAKKHGVQVTIPAMPAALVMPQNTPSGPASMANGFPPQQYPPQQSGAPPGWPNGGAVRTPQPPPGYNYGPYQPPQPSYPPQQQQSPAPGGYGGFGMPPGGAGGYGAGAPPPPQRQFAASPAAAAAPPPPGLPARPPPSLAGYGGPPGMGAPPGAPPGMPPAMQQGGYNRQPPPGYQGQR